MGIVPPNNKVLPIYIDRPLKRHVTSALYALSDIVETVGDVPEPMCRRFNGGVSCVLRIAVK